MTTAKRSRREPMVNIRMQPDEIDQLDEHAKAEGWKRSPWAREVILMLVKAGVTMDDVQKWTAREMATRPAVNGHQAQLGATRMLTGKCLHPVHLRTQYATFDRCRCGQEFHR